MAAALADPGTVEDGPVLCPFRLVTGLPCPGCGLIRSWVYLLHGQWGHGLAANPFGVLALVAALGLLVVVTSAGVRRRAAPPLSSLVSSRAFLVIAALWIAFGVVRLVAVTAGLAAG